MLVLKIISSIMLGFAFLLLSAGYASAKLTKKIGRILLFMLFCVGFVIVTIWVA